MSSYQDDLKSSEFSESYELESELADVFNRYAARNGASKPPEPHLLGRRNTIAVTTRKQSFDEYTASGFERQREKPAQLKLEKEIEVAQQRANELRMIQSVRQLTALEINELKQAELDEFESRRKLKRTKDAAIRAKRYRIKKAATSDIFSSQPDGFYESPGESQSPEDFRSMSSHSFTDPMTTAVSYISKLTNNPTSPGSRKRTHSPVQSQTNFQCSQCDAKFSVFGSFVSHMRTQHLKKDEGTCCKFCKVNFPNQQLKLAHVVEHFISTQTTFACQDCGKNFDNATQYRQHHSTYHTDVLHRCGLCLQIFTQALGYQEHMLTHAVSEMRYFCVACSNVQFDSIELLEAHIQLVHDSQDNNNGSCSSLPSRGIKKMKPSNGYSSQQNGSHSSQQHYFGTGKGLKCFVCDQECSSENALDEHRLFNHCKVPKGNQCAVCRQQLSSIMEFVEHMQQHSDGYSDMNCIICRQAIRNDQQLKLHGEYHLDSASDDSPGTTTKCSTCNQMVPECQMARHFLDHAAEQFDNDGKSEDDSLAIVDDASSSNSVSGVTLLTCHCGQQFDDQNELTAHALEHLSETLPGFSEQPPSFDCPKCPKRFSSLSALQGHSHVHMNTKMFKCEQCGQTFSTGTRLQQHRAKHLNKSDLKCRICDKRFPTGEQMQVHMRIHESSLNNFASSKKEVLEV